MPNEQQAVYLVENASLRNFVFLLKLKNK